MSGLGSTQNPEVLSAQQSENLSNLPDNSHLQCNMCVTGLDESLTSEDLHEMFQSFGSIKSAKVAIDASTRKSKCYGYVWFNEEQDCRSAILEARDFATSVRAPYPCSLFEMSGLRAANLFV